ncbi:ankyrin, partial [Bimuria novae-zelandiae CBS 107.79]
MRSPLDQIDATGKYPLMIASRNSPIATKVLLEEGAKVDQKDRWGRTAMMHFFCGEFSGRSSSVLRHLLDTGANVQAEDNSGHTALQFWARQLALVELLLKRGALVNAKTLEGITPLACAYSSDIVRVLLQYGADPNIPSSDGCTPLMTAARRGDSEVVEMLLADGADPNAQT